MSVLISVRFVSSGNMWYVIVCRVGDFWCACYLLTLCVCEESGHYACLALWNNEHDGTLFYIKHMKNFEVLMYIYCLPVEFIQILFI